MYYLFMYNAYDARGGWNDFEGVFPTVDEAKTAAWEPLDRRELYQNPGHIVDASTLKIIWSLVDTGIVSNYGFQWIAEESAPNENLRA
jgi:hypothetical protein